MYKIMHLYLQVLCIICVDRMGWLRYDMGKLRDRRLRGKTKAPAKPGEAHVSKSEADEREVFQMKFFKGLVEAEMMNLREERVACRVRHGRK